NPVFFSPRGVHRRTGPYVFFRLLVMVPAPRFTHRPRYEWPTNPSCDLFAWPRKIDVLTSPWTRQTSPMDALVILSPPTCESSPIITGPTMRVNACTDARRRISTGPAAVSKYTWG